MKQKVDLWIEHVHTDYPTGTETTYRRAIAEMADAPSYYGGRKTQGIVAIGDVSNALGNEQGTFEAASVDVTYADQVDRQYRELMDDQDLENDEFRIRMASPEWRAAGGVPRTLMRAVVQQPRLQSPLEATITAVDALFADFGPFGPNRQFPDLISPSIFPDAPSDSLSRGVPWIYGEKSDEGATDPATGALLSKGLCPLIYVGQENITRTVQTPTKLVSLSAYPENTDLDPFGSDWVVMVADRTGIATWPTALADQQHPVWVWLIGVQNGQAVRLVNAYKSTVHDTSGWSADEAYDPNSAWGVWVEWMQPPAQASNGQLFSSYRLYVADTADFDPFNGPGSATRAVYVDHDATVFDGTMGFDYTQTIGLWSDGTDALASVISGGDIQTVNQPWDIYLVAAHPVYSILNVYGSDQGGGSTAVKPDRMLLDLNARTDILVPGYDNWPFDTTYREFTDSNDGTVHWYTVIYARGPLSDNHKNGVINLAANVLGVEDVGDGTGLPIIDAHACQQHWIENALLNNWTSGLWTTDSDYPQWEDGTPKVRTSSFAARQAFTATVLGDRGLTIGWYVDTPASLSEHFHMWNISTESRLGIIGQGQIICFGFDETQDPADWPLIEHVTGIFGPVTRAVGEERENVIVGSADWDPDASRFRLGPATVSSAVGIQKYKNQKKQGDPLNSIILNTGTQFGWILQRRLTRLQVGTALVEITGGINLLDHDVGDGIRLTTIEGTGASGYIERPFIIVRRQFSISTRLVTYTLWDVRDLLIATRVPGGNGLALRFILTDAVTAPVLTDNSSLAPLLLV